MRNRKIKADVSLHEALEEIRQQVADNKPASYTKKGCSVSMADLPSERVILDVDRAFPTDKAETNQCDFILFYIAPDQSSLVGVPMELKGGDVDASEAIAQLREGARIVDNFTPRIIKSGLPSLQICLVVDAEIKMYTVIKRWDIQLIFNEC